jgi:hypothetical protein
MQKLHLAAPNLFFLLGSSINPEANNLALSTVMMNCNFFVGSFIGRAEAHE